MPEKKPAPFLLASFLETPDKNQVFQDDQALPLHVTVVPWFGRVSLGPLKNDLINRCCQQKPINIEAGPKERFGSLEHPVAANPLTREGGLVGLHKDTLATIIRLGGEVDSQYIDDKYRPHVTRIGEVGLDEEKVATLATLSLLEKLVDGRCRVDSTVAFSKRD